MFAENRSLSNRQAFIVRLLVGSVCGLVIAYLSPTFDGNGEAAAKAIWREVFAVTLAFTAFPIWAGAGSMRRWSLAIWALVVFVVVGYINWPSIGSDGSRDFDFDGKSILLFPLLFIAHELVSSGDQAGKVIAPFETYFDEAWKRGVQLGLAILFTLLFWGILRLGGLLLGFIGFDWLDRLLASKYFSLPITGLAFGTAVHLGDVQTKLLGNVRNLILGVLSWLLPVITLIGAIFAGSLLVSGLAPLWATKAATATLLGGCVGFVLLINAAYQQGDVERHVPVVLKWCVRGAAILLLIFAALAVWSLGLRIGQYGLTPERVFAGLGVLIALGYGIGYGIAVFVPGRWMAGLEPLNIGLAMFKCALFIAILTPLAPPDRLSVNNQVGRLTSGKVAVADFDWWLLKDETGDYGKKALTELAKSNNAQIATKAKAAIDGTIGNRPTAVRGTDNSAAATPADIKAIQVISPANGTLPESFSKTDFASPDFSGGAPICLREAPKKGELSFCKIALLDLNGDGAVEVLVRQGPSLTIFTQINGVWSANSDYIDIGSKEADFDAGKLRAAPSTWNDIMVGDRRLVVSGFNAPDGDLAPAVKEPASPPSK